MRQLHLEEGDIVNVEYIKLPVATFAKFQPKEREFLTQIPDPRQAASIMESSHSYSMHLFQSLPGGRVPQVRMPYQGRCHRSEGSFL